MKMDFSKIKSKGKPSAKPTVSPEHAKLIADALAKHAAKKPVIHVHVSTDSTHESSEKSKDNEVSEDW